MFTPHLWLGGWKEAEIGLARPAIFRQSSGLAAVVAEFCSIEGSSSFPEDQERTQLEAVAGVITAATSFQPLEGRRHIKFQKLSRKKDNYI